MIDEIFDKVKTELGSGLQDQFGLTDQQTSGTLDATKESVGESLQDQLKSKGIGAALNLFSKSDNDSEGNGLMETMGSNLLTKLVSKVGLDQATAKTVSGFVLPIVTNMMSSKVDGKSENITSMFKGGDMGDMVKGAAKSGLGGLASKLFG